MLNKFLLSSLQTDSYKIVDLPQDASTRKYSRVFTDNKSFILKHYNPSNYDPSNFIKITSLLSDNSIQVPQIYKIDQKTGLMLLEDLGSQTAKGYLCSHNSPIMSELVYKKIIDLLIKIQNIETNTLATYHSIDVMLDGIELFLNFFPQYISVKLTESEKKEFLDLFYNILKNFQFSPSCFVHRDFHVENIMVKDNDYYLIDYQDASIGSPIYDLASLIEDARIDMNSALSKTLIDHYCAAKNISYDQIKNEYDLLCAQRNMRILGVFTYHKIKFGNDKYVQYIPRVLKYLERDLLNPILHDSLMWLQSKKIIK